MPRPHTEQVQKAGVIRRLNVGALFVHDNHISGGFRKAKGCPVCGQGLAGAIEVTQEVRAAGREDAVAPGDGADQKGDTPSSSGDGTGAKDDGDSVLAW